MYKSEAITTHEKFADLKDSDPQRYRDFMAFANKINGAVEQKFELKFSQGEAVFPTLKSWVFLDSKTAGFTLKSV